MEIVGVGVDLVDVERMRRIVDSRSTFVPRVFSPEEIAYCDRHAYPHECYAARWAAREACRKALGGVQGFGWRDVTVTHDGEARPTLLLSGRAKERADELAVDEVKVSLTHERRMAAAFCVAVRRP